MQQLQAYYEEMASFTRHTKDRPGTKRVPLSPLLAQAQKDSQYIHLHFRPRHIIIFPSQKPVPNSPQTGLVEDI